MKKQILFLFFILSAFSTYSQSLYPATDGKKWGFTDKKEKVIIQYKYDSIADDQKAYYFGSKFNIVKYNSKWGLIDNKDNIKIPFIYDEMLGTDIGRPIDGQLFFVKSQGKMGAFDKKAKLIIPCSYSDFPINELASILYDNYRMVLVKDNDKLGLINKKWLSVFPCRFDSILLLNQSIDGSPWIVAKSNNKYGIILSSGVEIVKPELDGIGEMNENEFTAINNNYLLIRKDKKYGLISKTGILIPPIYDKIIYGADFDGYFQKGFVKVANKNLYGLVDLKGKEIISCKYDSIDYFSENMALVKKNKKYGFVDASGNEVIPLKFDYLESFYKGRATFYLNGEDGLIDKKGKILK